MPFFGSSFNFQSPAFLVSLSRTFHERAEQRERERTAKISCFLARFLSELFFSTLVSILAFLSEVFRSFLLSKQLQLYFIEFLSKKSASHDIYCTYSSDIEWEVCLPKNRVTWASLQEDYLLFLERRSLSNSFLNLLRFPWRVTPDVLFVFNSVALHLSVWSDTSYTSLSMYIYLSICGVALERQGKKDKVMKREHSMLHNQQRVVLTYQEKGPWEWETWERLNEPRKILPLHYMFFALSSWLAVIQLKANNKFFIPLFFLLSSSWCTLPVPIPCSPVTVGFDELQASIYSCRVKTPASSATGK